MLTRIYYFQVKGCERFAFLIDLNGLVDESAVSDLHFQKCAHSHAKIVSKWTEKPVRFYPENEEVNAREEDYAKHKGITVSMPVA